MVPRENIRKADGHLDKDNEITSSGVSVAAGAAIESTRRSLSNCSTAGSKFESAHVPLTLSIVRVPCNAPERRAALNSRHTQRKSLQIILSIVYPAIV